MMKLLEFDWTLTLGFVEIFNEGILVHGNYDRRVYVNYNMHSFLIG